MCLDVIYNGNKKEDALAKLPDSGYYWKVVRYERFDYDNVGQFNWLNNGKYYPAIFDDNPLRSGWNRTKLKYIGVGYKVGFHLFRSWNRAKKWLGSHEKIIRCIVKKEDIVAIGQQGLYDRSLTIVTSRFWMPKPS